MIFCVSFSFFAGLSDSSSTTSGTLRSSRRKVSSEAIHGGGAGATGFFTVSVSALYGFGGLSMLERRFAAPGVAVAGGAGLAGAVSAGACTFLAGGVTALGWSGSRRGAGRGAGATATSVLFAGAVDSAGDP